MFRSAAHPTISVQFHEGDNNVFFLHPGGADTIVAGTVGAVLDEATYVKSLSVEVVGLQRFTFRGKARCLETYRSKQEIHADAGEMQAGGEHTFAFSFSIPSHTAPTMSCELASTRYRLHASAKLGRWAGSVEVERKLALLVNRSGRFGGYPSPFNAERQFLHPRFGPTAYRLSTPYPILGGLLRWQIIWAAFLLPFRICDLKIEIVETIITRPAFDAIEPVEIHRVTRELSNLSKLPHLQKEFGRIFWPGDKPPLISAQHRIPYQHGPQLNATHHPDSRSCVQPTSTVRFALTFEQYEGGELPSEQQLQMPTMQLMEFNTPIPLSSCFCRLEHYKLPSYEEASATQSPDPRHQTTDQHPKKGPFGVTMCMCKELDAVENGEYGIERSQVEQSWQTEEAARDWEITISRKREEENGAS